MSTIVLPRLPPTASSPTGRATARVSLVPRLALGADRVGAKTTQEALMTPFTTTTDTPEQTR